MYDDDGNPLSDEEHIGGEKIIDLLEWKDCEEPPDHTADAQGSCDKKPASCDQGRVPSGDQEAQSTEAAPSKSHTQTGPMKVGRKAKSLSGNIVFNIKTDLGQPNYQKVIQIHILLHEK